MASAALHDIVDALKKTPERVSTLVSRLSDRQLRSKNSSEEFSALENVCHLRDIELDGYTPRITRILTEIQPALLDIDGSRLAAERDYNHQNLAEAVEAFVLARSNNVQTLQGLTAEQTSREGTLEGVGTISLQRLLEMIQEHDDSHIDELEGIRRRFDRQQAEAD